MFIFFILGLILGGAAVTFALQNTGIITIVFFSWRMTESLSPVLLLAMLSGVVITLLILLPKSISDYFKYENLKKEVGKLEEELRKQKELTLFAKKASPSPGVIEKIENGAITHPDQGESEGAEPSKAKLTVFSGRIRSLLRR
jgi:uncharacterized integral membrane protein